MTATTLPAPATPVDEKSESGASVARDERRWRAVQERDPAAEDRFVYAVETTGVYCRPTCAARRPRRQNVRFFADGREAEAAGFRPCRRCRPDGPSALADAATRIAAACRRLEDGEEAPRLADLAAEAGLGPHHFHRLFKATTGLTPKAYGDAVRAKRMGDGLAAGASVTAALYGAGFSSSSRFYEKAGTMLGMAPRTYRAGGAGLLLRYDLAPCALGLVLIAASEGGIAAIQLGDDRDQLIRDLAARFPRAVIEEAGDGLSAWMADVVALIAEPGRAGALPLDIRGTAFQQRVWQALTRIPPGTTTSYSAVAAALGRPGAARAVARACAENPLAVAIPCHRVVHADGTMSGFRWGVVRKRALQEKERP